MSLAQHKTAATTLVAKMVAIGRCVIAYSGGVDSAVVAAAVARADQIRLGDQPCKGDSRSIAVTADSPSVSREQLATAIRVAGEIGIDHRIVQTGEMDREDYRRNDRRRCFFCKHTLYGELQRFAAASQITTLVSGTNADDLGDYRPGIEAGNLAGVATPLASLGFSKQQVRDVAEYWKLSVFDRPAQPCLSSRVAYGVAVTRERLASIELAEQFLRTRHYTPLRVRLVAAEEARIEVSLDSLDRLRQPAEWQAICDYLQSLGFTNVSADPQGFRSGSMNELVQLTSRPLPMSPT